MPTSGKEPRRSNFTANKAVSVATKDRILRSPPSSTLRTLACPRLEYDNWPPLYIPPLIMEVEPRTTIPFDILATIIDLLAAEHNPDTRSLQVFSQACKSTVPLCRRHLFSSIQIHVPFMKHRFSNLLFRNPDIARYVRSVSYMVSNHITYDEPRMLEVLKERSSSLWSIELKSKRRSDWNELPQSIRSLLVSLIQLPTITHLKIWSFRNFPSIAVSLCVHLIDLQLWDLEMTPPEAHQVIMHSKIPTPESLAVEIKSYSVLAALMQPVPIVDFSQLGTASLAVDLLGAIYHIRELLKTTRQLRFLDMAYRRPVESVGLGASLATLRSAMFRFKVLGDDYDPLCGLSHELRMFAGNNSLEEFNLHVLVDTDAQCRTQSEDWAALDAVLTQPGAFPVLHQVHVQIDWFSLDRVVDEVEEVLGSLTEDRFPRLLECTAIEFNFFAQHHYEPHT